MSEHEIQVRKQPEKKKIQFKPYEHRTKYHETDQQGIIHPSYYVNWMEDARMDLMDQVGMGYKQMEELQVFSQMVSLSIEYRSPANFDEKVVVETKLVSYDGNQMEIAYRIYDKATGEDRAIAKSKHCFMNYSGIPISMKRIYPELETKFFEFK